MSLLRFWRWFLSHLRKALRTPRPRAPPVPPASSSSIMRALSCSCCCFDDAAASFSGRLRFFLFLLPVRRGRGRMASSSGGTGGTLTGSAAREGHRQAEKGIHPSAL